MRENNLILRSEHEIPIYELTFTLYVSRDARKTYNQVARDYKLALVTEDDGFRAMTICDGDGCFAIFFNLEELTDGTIAHEVRHCTDDIMRHIGHDNCKHCSNEPHAYLVGYLTRWIKRQVKRSGLRVKP